MSTLLDKGIEAIRKAPQDEQDRAGELLLLLAERRRGIYTLTPEEAADIDAALDEVERGEIASDEEVAALKRRHGLS